MTAVGMRPVWVALALTACSGAADPEPPAEPPAPAPAAEAAPEVAAESPWIDVDAASVRETLREHPAPALLVNVWSTWCEPCVEEMPDVIATARRYEGQGLGLALIAAEPPTRRAEALSFLREQGAPEPSYFKTGGDDAFIEALHPEWSGALPATLLLDRERRVVHFWPEPVDEAALRGPIEAHLRTARPGTGTEAEAGR